MKYTCSKCMGQFEVDHELDTDKPLCDSCFKVLVDYTHDYTKTAKDRANFHSNYLDSKTDYE